MKRIDEMNLAFIGVSHWHVPLYLRAVKTYGLNVVSVSDSDGEYRKETDRLEDTVCDRETSGHECH
jgi:hypothetical protein